jgi:hypothetical protein
MELAIKELPRINTTVDKNFLTSSVGIIVCKVASVDWAIRVAQLAGTLFHTVAPCTLILSPILPLAKTLPIHFALLPLARVGPLSLLTLKCSFALLKAIKELSFEIVAIHPFSNPESLRETLYKITPVCFTLWHEELAETFHFSFFPDSLVRNILI